MQGITSVYGGETGRLFIEQQIAFEFNGLHDSRDTLFYDCLINLVEAELMANKAVTLMRRCKTEKGWRRYPVALGKNGRVKPGWVIVGGEEKHYETGTYEVRYFEGKRPVFKAAGGAASEALAMRDRIDRQRVARVMAAAAGVVVEKEQRPRLTFAALAKAHVEDATQRGAEEAAEISARVAENFGRSWRGTFVDEIKREDILAFHTWLRKRGNVDRTVANKHVRLKSILRFGKFDTTSMPPPPKYEKKLPTIYEPEDWGAILRVAKGRMYLVCAVALKMGLREQEVEYMEWTDINQRERTHRVQSKPEWGFEVKDSEQRDVPIPEDLYEELRAWHLCHPKQALMFPGANGKPDGHLLRNLKIVARDARLNCGKCRGCCGERRECGHWTLHKFRRSYMTWLLRNGIDLRTCQQYAGHTDIESTMRYLRPASGDEAITRLNSIRWTD